ncbi:hypothetical protein ACWF94_23590 [Streptomyces sp. NPDC055078]
MGTDRDVGDGLMRQDFGHLLGLPAAVPPLPLSPLVPEAAELFAEQRGLGLRHAVDALFPGVPADGVRFRILDGLRIPGRGHHWRTVNDRALAGARDGWLADPAVDRAAVASLFARYGRILEADPMGLRRLALYELTGLLREHPRGCVAVAARELGVDPGEAEALAVATELRPARTAGARESAEHILDAWRTDRLRKAHDYATRLGDPGGDQRLARLLRRIDRRRAQVTALLADGDRFDRAGDPAAASAVRLRAARAAVDDPTVLDALLRGPGAAGALTVTARVRTDGVRVEWSGAPGPYRVLRGGPGHWAELAPATAATALTDATAPLGERVRYAILPLDVPPGPPQDSAAPGPGDPYAPDGPGDPGTRDRSDRPDGLFGGRPGGDPADPPVAHIQADPPVALNLVGNSRMTHSPSAHSPSAHSARIRELPTVSAPLLIAPDIADPRLTDARARVTAHWRTPPGVCGISVERHRPGSGPVPFDADQDGFTDRPLPPGEYRYTIRCRYRTAGGREALSPGVSVAATVRPWPAPVTGLDLVAGEEGVITATWTGGAGAEIRLLELPGPIPAPGTDLLAHELPGPPGWERFPVDHGIALRPPRGIRTRLTAVSLLGERACAGPTVSVELPSPVERLTVRRETADEVRVTFDWPGDADRVLVRWEQSGQRHQRTVTRSAFRTRGGLELAVTPAGARFTAEALTFDDADVVIPAGPGATVLLPPHLAVRYDLVKPGWRAGRRRRVVVRAEYAATAGEGEPDPPQLPDFVLVARSAGPGNGARGGPGIGARGGAGRKPPPRPRDPGDGATVLRLSGAEIGGGEPVQRDIDLAAAGEPAPYSLRAFLLGPRADTARLEEPPHERLVVR